MTTPNLWRKCEILVYFCFYLFIFTFQKPTGIIDTHWHSLIVTVWFSPAARNVDKLMICGFSCFSAFIAGPECLTRDSTLRRAVAGPLLGLTNSGFAGSSNFSCLLSMLCHKAFLVLSVTAAIKELSFLCAGLWIRRFIAAGRGLSHTYRNAKVPSLLNQSAGPALHSQPSSFLAGRYCQQRDSSRVSPTSIYVSFVPLVP